MFLGNYARYRQILRYRIVGAARSLLCTAHHLISISFVGVLCRNLETCLFSSVEVDEASSRSFLKALFNAKASFYDRMWVKRHQPTFTYLLCNWWENMQMLAGSYCINKFAILYHIKKSQFAENIRRCNILDHVSFDNFAIITKFFKHINDHCHCCFGCIFVMPNSHDRATIADFGCVPFSSVNWTETNDTDKWDFVLFPTITNVRLSTDWFLSLLLLH